MRNFDNTNRLSRSIILRRLQSIDAGADCSPYVHFDPEASRMMYYVGVESTLTDAQIEARLGPTVQADTDEEAADAALREWMKTVREKFQAQAAKVAALEAKVSALEQQRR